MKSRTINSSPNHVERLVKQIRAEGYAEGYAAAIEDVRAAVQNVLRIVPAPSPKRPQQTHKSPAPSLKTLILQKVAEHPDGIATADIQTWLYSMGDPCGFGTNDLRAYNAVYNALSDMRKSGFIERKLKDGYSRQGKWYRCSGTEAKWH
jgi:hypothetical protein